MIRLKPMRLPDWTNASVTDPDWAMPATPPRGRYGETSPMYVALLTVRSMTPMQFGPTRAMPCRRAMSATSCCIAAAAAPPSTTPPPGMITTGTPASAAAWVTVAARNGLSATIAMSGRSGSASSEG